MRTTLRQALLIAAAVLLTHAAASSQTPQHRAIDVAHSKAQFSVAHLWVDRVTGTVPIAHGEIVLPQGSLIPISATAVLDAAKVQTDEPDRDKALRSPDFFDTKKFPQWMFTSSKIVPEGPDAFEMDGDLTIHGVTRPETLKVTVTGDAAKPLYHATAEIDRHAFGMATTRLDPVIGTSIEVTLDIALS
jgi:polyisoprenoid-binding protein YceI